MSTKKKAIFVLLVIGYLICLTAGISGLIPVLNLYSDGSYKGQGAGYLWELFGMFCWLGILPLIPNRYFQSKSKWFTAFLIGPILLLTIVAIVRSVI